MIKRLRIGLYALTSIVIVAAMSVNGFAANPSAQFATTIPTFAPVPEHWIAQVVNADTTSTQTALDCTVTTYACNTLGTKIVSIMATNTDSAAHVVEFYINNGTETALLGSVNVPAFAGNQVNAGILGVNVLSQSNFPGIFIDSDGNPVITLTSSEKLQVQSGSTVNSPNAVSLFIQGPTF